MAVKIKICGITNEEDATWAANLGAHYLGFNFWSQSPRKVSVEMALRVVEKTPPFVLPVGVFVDHPAADIVKIVKKTRLRGVQLHGEQTPEECGELRNSLDPSVFLCKVFRVAQAADMENAGLYTDSCQYFLLDARVEGEPGGTGQTFPWDLAKQAKSHGVPIFLAGGLTPENVREAIKQAEPFGVDVASGVEKSPKRKDFDKLKSFIEQAKRA
ncbi:MAG TPA: phosphoribosylanthranilate isomerase [Elusimicrobiota bacterium]|nr:phosphoribosylanthranilate isomerase [Elusimicrobiota bacterium]